MAKRAQNKSTSALDEAYLDAVQAPDAKGEAVSGHLGVQKVDADWGVMELDIGVQKVDADWGVMELDIAPDAMRVTLNAVCARYDSKPVTSEQLLAEIRKLGIVHGVRAEVLMEVADLAKRPSGWQGELEVAQGTLPVASSHVVYPFLGDSESETKTQGSTWQLGEDTVSFGELIQALKVEEARALPYVSVLGVGAGEVLAVVQMENDGNEGKDVYGNDVTSASSVVLEAGDNVTAHKDGTEFVAVAFGFVTVIEGVISVVPPIWITPDRMSAYYTNFTQVATPRVPQVVDVLASLESVGVCTGIEESALSHICERLAEGEKVGRAVQLARGIPAVPGRDAYLDFEMDVEQMPGEVQEDGSIDLRERNLVRNVEKDTLIATKVEATEGVTGEDLFGETLETTDGKDVSFQAGSGTRMGRASIEGGSRDAIFAEIDGAVKVNHTTVLVDPVFRVNGDVDYETGNIAFEKDVYVTGSVKSGFSVSSGGNLTIAGSVESGAKLRSKNDLQVGKGILGETTTVVSLGDVRVQFVQNATIIARGDITVGSYVHNASVRCGGNFIITPGGGERGGSVIGGMICATKGVDVRTVGSMSTTGTVVALQGEPEERDQLKKLQEGIDFCEKNITKIMRGLGLRSVDAQEITRLLKGASPARREVLEKMMTKLNELVKVKRKSEEDQEKLFKKISRVLQSGRIKVAKKLFGGISVQIGNAELSVHDDLDGGTFKLEKGRVVAEDQAETTD